MKKYMTEIGTVYKANEKAVLTGAFAPAVSALFRNADRRSCQMKTDALRGPEDIIALTEEWGFLPFFAGDIPGFSVEERCLPELWFSEEADGPWEWKGPAARSGRCVYGKFFGGRAGFISREWFPDFANFRRNGYDFDARYEDGLASRKDKAVYDTVAEHGALLTKELKRLCDYRKGGNTGFDTVITRLQMQTYLTVCDFVYMQDKYGKPYGWGVAKYTTPEALFGYDFVTSAYRKAPAESGADILDHLKSILPDANKAQLLKLMK